MVRMFWMALVAVTICSAAVAQENKGASLGAFTCTTVADFSDASADTGGVKINNFSIREAKAFIARGASNLEISYAIANRSDVPMHVSADFMIFDGEQLPLAALNASPMLNTVQPGKTESASGDTFVNEGVLAKAKTICLRIYSTN
jgi:hypothetical protein